MEVEYPEKEESEKINSVSFMHPKVSLTQIFGSGLSDKTIGPT